MKLYLVQHGKAVAKDVDPGRPLSQLGHAEVKHLVELLSGRIEVSRVVHSGKMRAQQTAEIFLARIADGLSLEAISGIGPNDSVKDFAYQVKSRDEDLLVVGHLPFMAKLVSLLLTESADSDIVSYSPGSIVFLESLGGGDFQLQWMIRPELLTND
jgi:phosphohistidine phosphatase